MSHSFLAFKSLGGNVALAIFGQVATYWYKHSNSLSYHSFKIYEAQGTVYHGGSLSPYHSGKLAQQTGLEFKDNDKLRSRQCC